MPVTATTPCCLLTCVQCIALSSVATGLQQALMDHRKADETTDALALADK